MTALPPPAPSPLAARVLAIRRSIRPEERPTCRRLADQARCSFFDLAAAIAELESMRLWDAAWAFGELREEAGPREIKANPISRREAAILASRRAIVTAKGNKRAIRRAALVRRENRDVPIEDPKVRDLLGRRAGPVHHAPEGSFKARVVGGELAEACRRYVREFRAVLRVREL